MRQGPPPGTCPCIDSAFNGRPIFRPGRIFLAPIFSRAPKISGEIFFFFKGLRARDDFHLGFPELFFYKVHLWVYDGGRRRGKQKLCRFVIRQNVDVVVVPALLAWALLVLIETNFLFRRLFQRFWRVFSCVFVILISVIDTDSFWEFRVESGSLGDKEIRWALSGLPKKGRWPLM